MLQAIIAMSSDGAIGHEGKLPWPKITEDMKRFRSLTMGHCIIMGRKTWDSIGTPLKGRTNMVITRSPVFDVQDVWGFDDPQKALDTALETDPDPFIIGGAQIYKRFWSQLGRVYLTEVGGLYPNADTRCPAPEKLKMGFVETGRQEGVEFGYSFVTWERPRP